MQIRTNQSSLLVFAVLVSLLLKPNASLAAEETNRVPDEYESTGGHVGGFSNGGVAAVGGIAAVRSNPAMLSEDKEYTVSMGYHWPSGGREFYQAGVVDSKTSPVAAGLSYTGFNDEYDYSQDSSVEVESDSPVMKRAAVAMGQSFGGISAGIGGGYVEAHPLRGSEKFVSGEERVKGYTVNFGLAGYATPQIRWGASAENISNKKVSEYAPTVYRVGAAYVLSNNNLTAHLDYRQRQRVDFFESEDVGLFGAAPEEGPTEEKMVIGSFSARIFDLLRLLGSYGQALDDDRRTAGAGLVLVNKKFSLSYVINKPYLGKPESHNSLNFGFAITM